MKEKYPIEKPIAYKGTNKPYAWGIVLEGKITHLEYMDDFEAVCENDSLIDKRIKRKHYLKLSKSEVVNRMNHGRFMNHRFKVKEKFSKIAEKIGGRVIAGLVCGNFFYVN